MLRTASALCAVHFDLSLKSSSVPLLHRHRNSSVRHRLERKTTQSYAAQREHFRQQRCDSTLSAFTSLP
jgi:hypothetical protein